ncbi:acyl-CoA dehydrogenase family protein [Nocardia sp. NPDC051750]|uniref:acyl-CoA dehydrogenase family protein n=1 Tax=Nocardia sp. NPDC051750 TaxID=3364325 RepID=UPI003792B0F1
MTISEARAHTAEIDSGTGTTAALQHALFGSHLALHLRVRDALLEGVDDRPRDDLRHLEEGELAAGLWQKALPAVGTTITELATDTPLRGAVLDWAQVLAPRMFLTGTGQIDLSTYTILTLGDGSDYQQRCLSELDDATATGGLALTELDGTNGNDCQTTATYDPVTDGYWLDSPTRGASKKMPNVAAAGIPKTFVVTARLLVDGIDQGVLPFLARLRTADGLAEGVRVFRLGGKGTGPMDHALIHFRRFWLPREALVAGDTAQVAPGGRFSSDTPEPRARFGKVISVLSRGRLDLATAAAAGARAGLVGAVDYAEQRTSGRGTRNIERDNVLAQYLPAVAAAYATSTLGRILRDMLTDTPDDPLHVVLAMLAKPLLSDTAAEILQVCRRRTGSEGGMRDNRVIDWVAGTEDIITAEGENDILAVVAAAVGVDLTAIQIPGTPEVSPWYVDVLAQREHIIAEALANGTYADAGAVLGRDDAQVAYSTTTGHRLAATSLVVSADQATDPTGRQVLLLLAEAYALDRIQENGNWYNARGLMTPAHADRLEKRLVVVWRLLAEALPLLVAAFAIPVIVGAPLFAPEGYKAARAAQAEADQPGFFD